MQRPDTNKTCPAALLNEDTLGDIFEACVMLDSPGGWDSTSTQISTTLDTRRAPWVLGQVCRNWRRIVLSSPLLWTSINIQLDHHDNNAARHVLFLLDLYLSRSASCLLSVNIHSSICFQKKTPFFRSLLSTSSRWHTLLIDIPISAYEILSPLTGFLDSLAVLHIRLPHRNKSQAVKDFANLKDGIRLFKFCNNLERLSLQNIPFPRDIFHLPWAKIQDLMVNTSSSLVSNSTTLRALHGLRNLTSCSLECRFVINHPEHQYDAEAVDDSGMEVAQMLSWLTLPALKHLRLRQKFKAELEDSLVVEVIQLIRRSRCEIKALQLHLYPSISEEGIISILKEVAASLEGLCLHPGHRNSRVMSELLWRVRQSEILV
ncbi:hypothetical protein C8J55DRAFT_608069 [Lentinula edodes]|uniref:F-box domain-containing protein n=1 Tax=Lentinula lateritia TaxID=40482 RepID=A0A9W9A1D1_9AGAR|nr:hypothetical protein C8J55DRAFT_608069 [Lentinula edodes]